MLTKYSIKNNIMLQTSVFNNQNKNRVIDVDLSVKNMKKILLIALISIIFYLALQNLPSVINYIKGIFGLLSPFIIGLVIAFILNVPMKMLESIFFPSSRKLIVQKIRRPACLLLSVLLVLAILFLVAFLVIPEIIGTFAIIKNTAPLFLARIQQWIEKWSVQLPELKQWIASLQLNWERIATSAANFVKSGTSTVLGSAFSAVSTIFSGTFTVVVSLIFAVYILTSKEKLTYQAKKLIYAYLPEPKADRIAYVSRLSYKTFHSFVIIQFTEAVILGFLCFIGMLILGFPHAMTVSMLIGFTALIPLVGAFIGAAAGAFMILMIAPMKAIWFIVFIIILQQIEGNLIYPRVVGSSIGLPAIWVFVAVIFGGSVLGIFGMLIFVPLCSVIYNLIRESATVRLKNKDIEEEKLR